MQIQNIHSQKIDNNNKNVNFKGIFEAGSSVLRFLDTNQAWGANSVDLCSMVIPRTTIDFCERGPQAGAETARRESCGTLNHTLVGTYGTLAGLALAAMVNSNYGIRADKIFADNNTIEILADYWHNARKMSNDKNVYVKNFTDKIAENLKFFNTDFNKVDGMVSMSKDAQKQFSDALAEHLINSNDNIIKKDFRQFLQNIMTSDTGAETKVILSNASKSSELTSKTLVSNIYNVTKAFMKDKIDKVFVESESINKNSVVKMLKRLNIQRSVAGLGIAAGIGMSIQPLNTYLSKKKTGSDGFVGVPGRKKDKSTNFKILKTLVGTIFAAGALSTITTKPQKFLSKIQFQGMTPTINQLKFVYGMTIFSRLLSARDKDELRESAVKDTLGFLNLLVLGSLVTKGAARAFDKTLINSTKETSKNFFKWLVDSSLKTRDEVLYESLKQKGILTVRDGKAIPFKELIKLADSDVKTKLRKLNFCQIIGYVYSALVLGLGITKLNIYMTNKSEARRKAKLAKDNSQQINKSQDYNKMLNPQNIAFLSRYM